MSRIEFLSYSISERTPTYGNKNSALIDRATNISLGDSANSSKWIFQTNHIGTHIDFPKHFCNHGRTSSDYPPEFWIFNRVGFIKASVTSFEKEIQKLPVDIEILIWESGFGQFRKEEKYWSKQPVIPSSFGDLLKNSFPKIRAFGFDMISLTSQLNRAEGKKAHTKFLCEHQILVIEDMKLEMITGEIKQLIVSPWQIKAADGTPCTIFGVF